MNMDRYSADGFHYCAQVLEGGFGSGSMAEIERGLSAAYDLVVECVVEERHGDLVALARDLNAVYSPHRAELGEPVQQRVAYLGQLSALISLCDYIGRRQVPDDVWPAVGRSKYAKPVLRALMDNGALLATALSVESGLPHTSQLGDVVEPLIEVGLVKRERFGKNIWYSLTSSGRLLAGRQLAGRETAGGDRVGNVAAAVVRDLGVTVAELDALIDRAWEKHEEVVEARPFSYEDEILSIPAQRGLREFGKRPGDECRV